MGICVLLSAILLIAAVLFKWRAEESRKYRRLIVDSGNNMEDGEVTRRNVEQFRRTSSVDLIGPEVRGYKKTAEFKN